ncbi:C-C chemokine receptor type 5-like [Triplophysa rosa]|uniref:C-C chemokine receptor type 5-like n=1 Tax=Triplophysa rosa TaxID=992332 RepID=A0A9W7WRG8_TRIRA|nr:C-C chemokine receptor type 5-like [Triplophysa rosa]KAI7806959.1 putative C-C chemokine receptor type 5-like [Triplophysa rosa]
MTQDPSLESYKDYYSQSDDDNTGQPCNNGHTKAFSEVFLPTLYSIVFIIGFIGNSLVVWVLFRCRRKSNMTDVCLFNLALSDLLFLVSLPFWAHAAMAEWIFGKFLCHTVTGLYMLGLYGSIFFMVLMTLDRYVIIVHPYSIFSRNRSAKMGVVLASCVWMLSLFAALPNIIFAHVHNETNHSQYCSSHFPVDWNSFTYLELNLLSLVLPLIIMGYCYARVIPTLISIKSQKRHKIVRLILAVVAVYFLFWTPYNVAIFLQFLHQNSYLDSCEWSTGLSLAMQWVETIAFSHCCLNPIIYGFVGEKFRRTVIKVVKEQFPMCFRQCATFSQQLSERRGSVFSRSTEYSSTHIM